jgi:hypothetical protein
MDDLTDADSFMEMFAHELQEDGSVTAEEIETLAESLQSEMKNLTTSQANATSAVSSATVVTSPVLAGAPGAGSQVASTTAKVTTGAASVSTITRKLRLIL